MDSSPNIDTIEKDFFLVYHYWYKKLYSFIYLKTKSPELSEDIVQHTFLRVWERRNLFNEHIKFSSQLFQIARTSLIDELRKQALARKYIDYEKPFISTQYIDLERQLIFKDQLEFMKNILKEMPLMRQKVFFMHKIEQLTHKEISQELSISIKTVENHITLAFKYLKKFRSIS